jgi:hypothetical protein
VQAAPAAPVLAEPPSAPPPKITVFRTSGAPSAASSPASAIAVAVAPSTPEPAKPANPVLTLVPTPAPEVVRAPVFERPARSNAPQLPSRGAAWLVAVRRRPWIAVSISLALAGVTCLVIARTLSARKPGPSAPPVMAADPPPAQPQLQAPPRPEAPPPAKHVTDEAAPPESATGHERSESRKAHRSEHEHHGAHHHEDRPSRSAGKKHGHEVALDRSAQPAQPGDNSAARSAYANGNRLLLNGDTAGAIAAYQEATRLAPSSPAGYRGLGLANEKQGNRVEAARAFRRYLKLAPAAEDRALIADRLQSLAPARKAGKR